MGHNKKIEECRWIIPLVFRQNYVDVFFLKKTSLSLESRFSTILFRQQFIIVITKYFIFRINFYRLFSARQSINNEKYRHNKH